MKRKTRKTTAGQGARDAQTGDARRRNKPQAGTPLTPNQGLPAAPSKERTAKDEMAPTASVPSARSKAGAKATPRLTPKHALPSPAPFQPGGDGQICCDAQNSSAVVARAVSEMGRLVRERRFWLRRQATIDRPFEAYARTVLGWEATLPKKERERRRKLAMRTVKSIRDDQPPPKGVSEAYAAQLKILYHVNRQDGDVREHAAKQLALVKKQMEKMAELLPVAPWVQSVRGFGMLNLAILIGTCGSPANFANPDKLKKFMGMAPDAAYRMTCKSGREADKIPKPNRAICWVVGGCLIKGNQTDQKKPLKYRKLYLKARKDVKRRFPGITKPHFHNKVWRPMMQRALIDLWRAWRDATEPPQAPPAVRQTGTEG